VCLCSPLSLSASLKAIPLSNCNLLLLLSEFIVWALSVVWLVLHFVLHVNFVATNRVQVQQKITNIAKKQTIYNVNINTTYSTSTKLIVERERHKHNNLFIHSKSNLSETTDNLRIYVITLQGVNGAPKANQNRFDTFIGNWTSVCGDESDIRRCPGALDKRRGYGLTNGFRNCIALAERESSVDDDQPVLFFEDDARLFDARFCAAAFRRRLWSTMPTDTFLALLGGWRFRFPTNRHTGISWSRSFVPLTSSWGSSVFSR
jgi:hypothetical protein